MPCWRCGTFRYRGGELNVFLFGSYRVVRFSQDSDLNSYTIWQPPYCSACLDGRGYVKGVDMQLPYWYLKHLK